MPTYEEEQYIKSLYNTEVLEQEPMAKHTTFGVGGPADWYLIPSTFDSFLFAIRQAREWRLPYVILGNGSNVLVRDEGIRGIVISTEKLDQIEVRGKRLMAGCGAKLSQIAAVAQKNGLRGLEFAAGIPGTLGGAIFMNAGAYGGEMADVVSETVYLDIIDRVISVKGEEQAFGYRTSFFKQNPDRIIVSAILDLELGDPRRIQDEMAELAEKRRAKQPLEYKSAGSTFQRPEGHYAGQLIEEADLKGFTIGGAQVSEKHAGFVINLGNATAQDILDVMETVKKRVYETSGVTLEPEVRVL